jgi:pimeloyl-ACP methyl ester carboxylesterase
MVERLSSLQVPVLLLIGEFDTPDNHEAMRIIRSKVPQAKLRVVPDAGHVVNVENAPFVNDAITELLFEKVWEAAQ